MVGLLIASWTLTDAATVSGWTRLAAELTLERSLEHGSGTLGDGDLAEYPPAYIGESIVRTTPGAYRRIHERNLARLFTRFSHEGAARSVST
jgi:hypothetical protein